MQKLIDYFSPHRRIARRLRWLQKYAGKHYFTIAYDKFGRLAEDFDKNYHTNINPQQDGLLKAGEEKQ